MANIRASAARKGDHWAAIHNAAITESGGFQIKRSGDKAFESPIVGMLTAWAEYAIGYSEQYNYLIGDDGVLGDEWKAIGLGMRGLLNGVTGRLDCGTLDAFILDTMKENGIDTEEL